MTDLPDLIVRWQRGWSVARGLPAADPVPGGLRVRCQQPGRDVEYVALDPSSLPALADAVLREDEITWLTVPTTTPEATAAVLRDSGLVLLKRAEQLMAVKLREQPQSALAGPYRLEGHVSGQVATVTVWFSPPPVDPPASPETSPVTAVDSPGKVSYPGPNLTPPSRGWGGVEAAHGTMGLSGRDAVADRILTAPGHRRRGLARVVMGALAEAAAAAGAEHGLLIASEEGRHLYAALGWRAVADVLIAAPPGTDYPA
ncbi:GNAT family N-acetyltransferase [Actinoplanes sp. CA-030573]|uniref:GNAT family N-acetyltransferase n=1 Tax=Actinoplanes sp. CA-030573 TaxID=3239898 RepID=UPI003D904E23